MAACGLAAPRHVRGDIRCRYLIPVAAKQDGANNSAVCSLPEDYRTEEKVATNILVVPNSSEPGREFCPWVKL